MLNEMKSRFAGKINKEWHLKNKMPKKSYTGRKIKLAYRACKILHLQRNVRQTQKGN